MSLLTIPSSEADSRREENLLISITNRPSEIVVNLRTPEKNCCTHSVKSFPTHKIYMTVSQRLESFKTWPRGMRQMPDEMAQAGFFYKGVGDQTVCFHCGGFKKDWQDEQDPWKQHALWLNRCPYLLAMKGEEFIRSVIEEKNSAVARSVQRSAETSLCKMCNKCEYDGCFVPCGHVVVCRGCAASMSSCSMCRQPYTFFQKLYFA